MTKKNFSVQLLIAFSLSFIGCDNSRESSESYFKKGKELYEMGQYKGSEIELKNAIQENPNISDAFFYMALLDEKAKKYKAMRVNLLEAVKLDPDNKKARLKLSKLLLLFNEIDLSLEQIEWILDKYPDELNAYSIKASILIRKDDIEDALLIIDKVLLEDPNHIEAVSLKTIVLMRKKLFNEAESLLLSAIQNNKENISLLLLKIQLDSKQEDIDSLIGDYEKLVALKPDNLKARLVLSHVYFKANKFDKAEAILIGLVEKYPGLSNVELELLDFLYITDNKRSFDQLNVFIEKNRDVYSSIFTYYKWFIRKDKINEAKVLLSDVLKNTNIERVDKDKATLLLVQHKIKEKKFELALEDIESILKGNPDDFDAKIIKAKVYAETEKYADAIDVLEKILLQKPNMDQALSLLGANYEVQGELDKAYANHKDALKINPKNLRSLNFIVSKEVSENHVDYAIELLERALRYIPSQLVLMSKLVELNILEKDWDKANKYINRIKKQKNGALLAQFFSGKVFQQQKQYESAILVYKELLTSSPWLKDVLVAMADCYSKLNKKIEMVEYLDFFIKSNPNISSAYILKSQLLSEDKKVKNAIVFLKDALKNDKVNHNWLYVELASLYKKIGNNEAEFNAYKDGLRIYPNNINLMLPLAAFYERNKEYSKARDLYEEMLQVNPGLNVVKNNLATILIDRFSTTEDIEKALQLTKTFKQSKQSYFLDTYGWALLKSGKLEAALSVFKKVILLAPDVPVFYYHLGVGLFESDDMMSAAVELRQALYAGSKEDFPEKALVIELLTKIKKRK